MTALITAAEVQKILHGPHVKILDASYKQPPADGVIPGTVDFDIDDIADLSAPFAHTVPTAEIFAAKVGALGIGNDDLVIIYDRAGVSMAAARAWWMFRLFGHNKVRLLNGGLPAWTADGFPIEEKSASAPTAASFTAALNGALLKNITQMTDNLDHENFSVIDARDTKRFETGHIPKSYSVPYANLIDAHGALKPRDELEKYFRAITASAPDANIACSCGSGVTACVLALALFELEHENVAVYDGSWTEWGAHPTLPKSTGSGAS